MTASFNPSLPSRLATALREHTPAGPLTEAQLRTALESVLAHPGRLLRGQLVYRTALANRAADSTAEQLACAVEYYHLASLILDDLPCMDDGEIRRGRPCLHHVHGEATAVLAALALINRGYALVGWALATQPVYVRVQAQAALDTCLGTMGMIGGQARDLRFAQSGRGIRETGRIALTKTGSLFWLSVAFPSLLGNPTPSELRALKALCVYWGLAHQVIDDLQDVLATSLEAGKTTGRDRTLIRPNLALALGIPRARVLLRRLLGQAARRVHSLRSSSEHWAYLEEFQQSSFVAESARALGGAGHAA